MTFNGEIGIGDLVNFGILLVGAIALLLQFRSINSQLSDNKAQILKNHEMTEALQMEVKERTELDSYTKDGLLEQLEYSNLIYGQLLYFTKGSMRIMNGHLKAHNWITKLVLAIIYSRTSGEQGEKEVRLIDRIETTSNEIERIGFLWEDELGNAGDEFLRKREAAIKDSTNLNEITKLDYLERGRYDKVCEDINKKYGALMHSAGTAFQDTINEVIKHFEDILGKSKLTN